jgi:hypothetical protein
MAGSDHAAGELAWSQRSSGRKVLLAGGVVLHFAIVALATCELKSSRVRDFSEIERVAAMLPKDARVMVS